MWPWDLRPARVAAAETHSAAQAGGHQGGLLGAVPAERDRAGAEQSRLCTHWARVIGRSKERSKRHTAQGSWSRTPKGNGGP